MLNNYPENVTTLGAFYNLYEVQEYKKRSFSSNIFIKRIFFRDKDYSVQLYFQPTKSISVLINNSVL